MCLDYCCLSTGVVVLWSEFYGWIPTTCREGHRNLCEAYTKENSHRCVSSLGFQGIMGHSISMSPSLPFALQSPLCYDRSLAQGKLGGEDMSGWASCSLNFRLWIGSVTSRFLELMGANSPRIWPSSNARTCTKARERVCTL